MDISTDLILEGTGSDARLVPEMVPVDVSLGLGDDDRMATVMDGEGHSVTESWPFGPLPSPVVVDNTATYREVLPGVDLVQIVRNHGVSQVLKIATPEAAADPRVARMRVHLDTVGVKVSEDVHGGLVAHSLKDGGLAFRTGPAQWWDSSHKDASVLDAGGPGLTQPFELSLKTVEGGHQEIFGMETILDAEGVTYPIYVDPEWSANRASYVYVDSSFPTTSYWNGQHTDAQMQVGFLPAKWNYAGGVNKVTRSYWQFNTSPMAGKEILAARFNVTQLWAPSCTARPVDAWVTGGVGSGTTWNAQPGFIQQFASANVAKGYSSACPQGTVGFNMASVKDWITTSPQWTIGLRADNEADELGWKRFANAATVIITYNTKPSAPKVTSMTGCGTVCTGVNGSGTYTRYMQPTFGATATDPDGGNLGVNFTLRRNGSTTVVHSSASANHMFASGGSTTWKIPAALSDGAYNLTIQSRDPQGSISSNVLYYFTVDTKAPPAPKVVPVTAALVDDGIDPDGIVGQTAYTFNISQGGSDPVRGYIYSVLGNAMTQSPPGSMTCNQRVGVYIMICPAAGSTTSVKAAAITRSDTTLSVWAVDEAGNVGVLKNSGLPTTEKFSVGNMAPMPASTIPTTTILGAASWTEIPTFGGPIEDCTTGGTSSGDGLPGAALNIGSGGGYASTSERVLDLTNSFTMSAWFCLPDLIEGTIMAQQNDLLYAGASLSVGNGKLVFSRGDAPGQSESVSSTTTLQPGSWYFANAVYDKVNRQMRLTVSNANVTDTWIVSTTGTGYTPASLSRQFMLGTSNPRANGFPFVGQIARPTGAVGVLSNEQFNSLWDQQPLDVAGVLK
ncbi:Ig-like domain-containing protein [Arthrobacter sp. TMT4-20]